jgi:hypothetical protein
MRVVNLDAAILKFPKPAAVFRAAIFTMVYNEKLLLPFWRRHYGRQVGYENLFVIDQGSTDGGVDSNLCNHVRMPRDSHSEGPRAELVSLFQAALLTTYDVVIYTDCDEFLVARPSKFLSLLSYLENRREKVTRCVGMNLVPDEPGFLPLDLDKPIVQQRPFGFVTHWQYKPLVTSIPLNWSYGFHNCDRPDHLDTDLWLFHLKLADVMYNENRRERLGIDEKNTAAKRQDSDETLRFIEQLQGTREDVYFTDDEFAFWFRTQKNSPLRRVPEEFKSAF